MAEYTVDQIIGDPSILEQMTPAQVSSIVAQLQQQGYTQTAQTIHDMWATIYTANANDEKNNQAEQAADPWRNMAMGAGSAFLGAGAYAGANAGVNALTGGNVHAIGPITANGQTSILMSDGTVHAVGSGATGGAGTTAIGSAPGTPVVVSGEPAAAGASAGLASPLAMALAGAAATVGGHELADQYGGTAGQNLWAGANTMNPINQAWQAGESLPEVMSGGRIPTAAELALAIPTGGMSFLYNPLFARGGLFGSTKSDEQMHREALRGQLEDIGFLPDNDVFSFSDQGTFDFGQDGGAMLKGGAYDGQRHYYDVDWGNKLSGNIVGALDPLVSVLFPDESPDYRAQMVGYMTNAAQEGEDPMSRVTDMWSAAGYQGMEGRNRAYNQVLELAQQGMLTPEERNARLASIDRDFHVTNPNQGRGGREEFGDNWIE